MGDVEDIPIPEGTDLGGQVIILSDIMVAEFRQSIVEQFDTEDQQVIHGMLLMLTVCTDTLERDLIGQGLNRMQANGCANATLNLVLTRVMRGLCDTFPPEHAHGRWPLVTLASNPNDVFPEGLD